MPDYSITIHMKIGPPKVGVRWHPSYDTDFVQTLVERKVRKTIGMSAIKWIEIKIVARARDDRMDTRNLSSD